MFEKKRPLFNFLLPDDLKKELTEYCKEEDLKLSQAIRIAIRKLIKSK